MAEFTPSAAARTAARVPELSEAVFRRILHSHHDEYGDLDPAAALPVLDQMRLPGDTEHLAELRSERAPALTVGPAPGPARAAVRRGAGGP
ncbi:hypothetical protein [Streptomyces sp. DSM 40907]|uniref:hypothetical protein n=1 Tax=Streptomyces kutzneri TaxID=3051179 RepID=UPI0028D4E90B|nr:hypothetical protein [Streptomyces sp. DSM 40907]